MIFLRAMLIGALAFGYTFFSVDAHAQEANKPGHFPIAIVDMSKVRQESTALQSISEQIVKYRNVFQKEVQDEEKSLRDANQELARQRTIVSAEAFNSARKDFEARVASVQRDVQKRKTELETVRSDAMRELTNALNTVIAEIAKERGYALVLRRDQTVMSAKVLEITDEVTKRLNTKLPDVKVPKPEDIKPDK